ncbi:MAG: membrane protein insertion efficiency factor YidD [bacterium]
MTSLAARAVLASVRTYQEAVSPLRRPSCRYVPSCSAYAVEAVERFGAARGSYLAVRRLLRCHPLHAGGLDPVPGGCGHGQLPAGVEPGDGSGSTSTDAPMAAAVPAPPATTRTSQLEFRP